MFLLCVGVVAFWMVALGYCSCAWGGDREVLSAWYGNLRRRGSASVNYFDGEDALHYGKLSSTDEIAGIYLKGAVE